ncbi:hypothetical protein NKG99_31385 [Mesorhizobium sp. M1409]|uniref:hypothetical protein n=1 Tax=Mesorhizobium sp. M1409 TaxID=2957100 RepID=UPI0033389640
MSKAKHAIAIAAGGHNGEVRYFGEIEATTASEDLRKKRQQLLSFLLRHGRVFAGHKNWSRAHARWLAAQKFDHPAQQIVFQDQGRQAAMRKTGSIDWMPS